MTGLEAKEPTVSATGTKMTTKGARMAAEMKAQLGAVAVPAGTGGQRLVSEAEAKRRQLIDAEKAKLEAAEKQVNDFHQANDAAEMLAAQAETPAAVPGRKKGSSSSRVKASRPSLIPGAPAVVLSVVPEPETIEQVIAREVAEGKLTPVGRAPKAPYNPKPLSGAAEKGKAPQKGQLPAGLIAYLAAKHAKSAVIAAAAGGHPGVPMLTDAQRAKRAEKKAKRTRNVEISELAGGPKPK